MRALDEVAEAVRRARGGRSVPVRSAFGLEEVLGGPPNPHQWAIFKQHLSRELPPLRFDQGHWFLPDGFATIWDLADVAARSNPGWEVPAIRTEAVWRDAQLFAGVRTERAGALSLAPEQVTRTARLKADLGAE